MSPERRTKIRASIKTQITNTHLTAKMASSSNEPTSAKADTIYKGKLGTVTILNPKNYPEFEVSVVPALMAGNLWRIITGEYTRTDENKETWDAEAGRIMGLLNNCVISSIRSTFKPFLYPIPNPVGLWNHLKSFDTTANPAIVNDIRKEFDDFAFDESVGIDIMDGVLELQRIKTMLSGTSKKISDEELKSKLLSSLPNTDYWHGVKVKATEDQKDLQATITSLLAYERPKPKPNSASMAASNKDNTNKAQGDRNARNPRGGRGGARTRGRGGRNRGGRGGRGRGSGRGGGSHDHEDSKVQKDYTKDKISADQCAFCRKKGHYQADCHVYKRLQAQYIQEQEAKGDGKAQGNVAIATRMSHDQIKDAGFPYLTVPYAMPSVTGHEHALHIANKVQSHLDSGATRHFSGIKSDFTQLKHWMEPEVVHVANGQTTKAIGYGTIELNTSHGKRQFKNVWYVPDFGNTRLISVWELNKSGISVEFDNCIATATVASTGESFFRAIAYEGLYTLESVKSEHAKESCDSQSYDKGSMNKDTQNKDSPFDTSPTHSGDTVNDVGGEESEDWMILHRRLGHVSYKRIDQLLDGNSIGLVKPKAKRRLPKGEKLCEPCLAGKMKESFNKKTDKREGRKVRRLHADLSGYHSASVRGFRYFLVVSCDASRIVWVKLLKTKSTQEVYPALAEIRSRAERSTGEKCIYFRADNGTGEFGYTFQESLIIDGVQFEPSPAYKHSLNGVIERAIGIIAVTARSIMYEAGLPYQMWDYAVEHAVWIKNRVPTAALPYGDEDINVSTSITPYRAFTGDHPDFKNLRVFGCKAVPYKIDVDHPTTFEPRIKDGTWIFIGMEGNSIWKVLNVETLAVVKTTDARFDEYTFPHITSNRIQELEREAIQAKQDARATRKQRSKRSNRTNQEDRTEQPTGGARVLQDPDNARPTKEARAKDLARPIEEARAPEVEEGINSENTIIVEPPVEGSNPMEGSNSTPEGDYTSLRRKVKNQIKARKADGAEPKVWPTRGSVESPYELRSKSKRTEFSDTIAKMAKAMLVADVELELDQGEPQFQLSQPEPEVITVQQAMRDNPQEWLAGLLSELESLIKSGTFKILKGPPPPGVTPRSCKIVLRNKMNTDNTIARHKARVVIRGFEQQYGIDYWETFASVVRYDTLRALLAKAAVDDLEIDQMDVNTAFLNPNCEEEIYMQVPDYFDLIMPGITKSTHYLQLLKALYGLKQAPRAWFQLVKKEFGKLGLQPSDSDPNLFIGRGVYLLLFVDDMLIIGNRKPVDSIKREINRLWDCTDLKAAKTFVGFQIERNRQNRTLRIHQTAYITRLLERLGMANSNPRDLPIPAGTVLRSTDQDLERYEQLDEDQAAIYRTIVGATIYLSNITRPDIAYATGQLARMMSKPNTNHLSMAKGLLRYLKGTATAGITYHPTNQGEEYKIWSDATWGTEDDRKSFQGYTLIRHGGAISWTANRQKSTAQSTMEAEICAGSDGARQAAWFEKMVKDLDEKTNIPILMIDNAAAEELAKTWKSHSKAKHIEIKEMFIRDDMVLRNRLVVQHTPSVENIADALTKQLPKPLFDRHIQGMGMARTGTLVP